MYHQQLNTNNNTNQTGGARLESNANLRTGAQQYQHQQQHYQQQVTRSPSPIQHQHQRQNAAFNHNTNDQPAYDHSNTNNDTTTHYSKQSVMQPDYTSISQAQQQKQSPRHDAQLMQAPQQPVGGPQQAHHGHPVHPHFTGYDINSKPSRYSITVVSGRKFIVPLNRLPIAGDVRHLARLSCLVISCRSLLALVSLRRQ